MSFYEVREVIEDETSHTPHAEDTPKSNSSQQEVPIKPERVPLTPTELSSQIFVEVEVNNLYENMVENQSEFVSNTAAETRPEDTPNNSITTATSGDLIFSL